MTFPGARAGDTAIDAPLFLPQDEHERLVAAVMEARHERDALAEDVERLEKDLARARQAARETETARPRSAIGTQDAAQRELQQLREILGRKEGEIRRFQEGHQTLERLVTEAREKIQTLKNERAQQDREIVVRDRALAEIDRRFASLERDGQALRAARDAAEKNLEAASVEKARAIEQARSEGAAVGAGEAQRVRAEMGESFAALERDYQSLEVEMRRRVRETEERLQSAMDEIVSFQCDEIARVRAQYEQQIQTMASEHAWQLASLERASTMVREALESAHAGAEGARLGWEVRYYQDCAELREAAESMRRSTVQEFGAKIGEITLAHATELQTLRTSLEAERDFLFDELTRANADLARELDTERTHHSLERLASHAAHTAEIQTLREQNRRDTDRITEEQADALVDAEQRRVAEVAAAQAAAEVRVAAFVAQIAALEARIAALDAQLESAQELAAVERAQFDAARSRCDGLVVAARREIEASIEAREREALGMIARHQAEIAALRNDHAGELDALRSEHAVDVDALRAGMVRLRDDERARREQAIDETALLHQVELDAASERHERALAEATTQADERIAALRTELDERMRASRAESEAQRERIARQLADANTRLKQRTEQSQRESAMLVDEARRLAVVVGEVTSELLSHVALCSALRRKRTRPEAFDVDEALAYVTDIVPDDVSQNLWASRDLIVEQLTTDARMTESA